MKSKLAFILLIIIGLCITSYSLWEIVQTNFKADKSLDDAKKVLVEQKLDHPKMRYLPKKGETVGILEIPKIESELAIIEGTDPDELEKGVGHYKGSYYPNENGQIILSGHRDTVFRKIGELELGDELKLKLSYGDFSYKIIETKIVDDEDTSIITLQNEKEELILTTCYPFRYIGNAPQRYIMYAEKIKENE